MAFRLAAALLVLAVPPVFGQDVAGLPQRWGTAADSIYTLQAYAFEPVSGDGANLSVNGFAARFCSSACSLAAPVTLPSGVSLRELELELCDTSATGQVTAFLGRFGALETASQVLGTTASGAAATPGCAFFSVPLSHTVDNLSGTYVVQVTVNGINNTTRFQAVRLFYRLQVSPAPATASFGDVPVGSPIHRFVEALAAAGITGGCGGGNFCPDAPLTRGQMAVFLSTALGLHFPN